MQYNVLFYIKDYYISIKKSTGELVLIARAPAYTSACTFSFNCNNVVKSFYLWVQLFNINVLILTCDSKITFFVPIELKNCTVFMIRHCEGTENPITLRDVNQFDLAL